MLASETSNSTNSTNTRYTLDAVGGLPERLGATQSGSTTWYVRGWGEELSRESGGSTSAWFLPDRLGSIRGHMNDGGSLTSSFNYDPFGNRQGIFLTGSPPDYGFTGEANSGLGVAMQMHEPHEEHLLAGCECPVAYLIRINYT